MPIGINKELIDKISLSKLQRDPNPMFNWTLSLRNSSKNNIFINKKTNNYWANSFTVTPKISNLNHDNELSISLFKTSIRESRAENRNLDRNKSLKESWTIQQPSDIYYLEPTSKNPDGIWSRKKSIINFTDDQEIIRKSLFNILKVEKDEYQESSLIRFIPKSLIKGYVDCISQPKLFKPSSSKSSMHNTFDCFEEKEVKPSQTIYGIDNDKDLRTLEIVGSNKLTSEIRACNSIINEPKFFIKNHFLNEIGEGEPDESEEIIEQWYC